MPPTPWSPMPRMRSPSVTTMTSTSALGRLRRSARMRVAVRVREEQAARPAVDVAELLARLRRPSACRRSAASPRCGRAAGGRRAPRWCPGGRAGRCAARGRRPCAGRPRRPATTCSSSVSTCGGSSPCRPSRLRSSSVNAVPLLQRRRVDDLGAGHGKAAEPEVGTFTVRPQSRALIRELPGRIAPTRVSDVRARVSGIVVERLSSRAPK